MDLEEIFEALANRARTVEGLRATPGMWGQINPPQAVMKLGQWERRGAVPLQVDLWVLVGTSFTRASEQLLRAYASEGPQSVARAIENDPTLGGVVDDVTVSMVDREGALQLLEGQPAYLGVRLQVDVIPKELP